jgi:hypothetical protein
VDERSPFCCTSHALERQFARTVLSELPAPPRRKTARDAAEPGARDHSHSIVEGGFDEMSRATRLTAGISLMIRLEIASSRS